MNKITQKIDCILQNKALLYGLIVCGLLIKCILLPKSASGGSGGDYETFLKPWVDFIKNHGYFSALKYDFSNYTPVYQYFLVIIAKTGWNPLYAIKILSIIFEYVTAYFIAALLYEKTGKKYLKLAAFAIFPLLPTVLINSSYWGQCDSIYVSFIVASLFFFFKNKTVFSFLFLGIAFAFKLQPIIIFPFFFVLLLKNQVRWYHFLIIPTVYIISILPAWFAGRPWNELLTIYVNQQAHYSDVCLNFPNIYVWINHNSCHLPVFNLPIMSGIDLLAIKNIGLIFTAAFCLISGYILKGKKYNFSFDSTIKLAFLCSILIPFILPGMHERYMFLGDTLSVIYLLLFAQRLYIPFGVITVSTVSYLLCTRFHDFIPMHLLSILYFSIIVCLLYDFLQTIPIHLFKNPKKA
jgi:Gpi18-like mannosyltransferase